MDSGLKFVVVTACPTGVALTYMAANRLAAAGQQLGHALKIETQGAMGSEDVLSRKDIARADAAIFAADIDIGGEARFEGMPQLRVSTREAIAEPVKVLVAAANLVAGAKQKTGVNPVKVGNNY